MELPTLVKSGPTLPSGCGLALAIPLTWPQFQADSKETSGKEFIRSWMGQFEGLPVPSAWTIYKPFADLIEDVAAEAKGSNVAVEMHATLQDWIRLLTQRPVVTLVAHYNKASDQIEFADGLHDVAEVLKSMPEGYSGTLDLPLCFSLELLARLKRAFRRATFIVNAREAQPHYRLAIYRQVLRLLLTGTYNYVDATSEVQLAVLKHAKFASAGS